MEKIYVAKLGKSVGLKGQMRLYIDSDFPEQFKKGVRFTTNKNKLLEIESINQAKDTVKFLGIDTIEDSKIYTNSLLYVTDQETIENCKLGENQYFWFDIIGCSVFEGGVRLGLVSEVNRFPLDDYMTIDTDEQLIKKDPKCTKSFLLPYNKSFVISVDIQSKSIEVMRGLEILEAS